jgi:hypothetical protein
VREVEEIVEAEVPAGVATQQEHADSSSMNNDSKASHGSDAGSHGDEDPTVDADEALRSYGFGLSTIMVSYIREMGALNYFVEGDACVPGEKIVP